MPTIIAPSPPPETATRTLQLYSRGQVIAATFFGSVLAGTHLVAANWRRLGQPRRVATAWVIGGISFVATVAILLAIPDHASASAHSLPLLLGIAVVERLGTRQRPLVQEQVGQGATHPSDWAVGMLALCYAAPFVGLWVFSLL